jgi:hypothetical protein
MDPSSPTTWATLYAVAALGYLTSRLFCVYQYRHGFFRATKAMTPAHRAAYLSGSACMLLLIAAFWPLYALKLVWRRVSR